MKMKSILLILVMAIMTLSLVACPFPIPKPPVTGDVTSTEKVINVYLIAGQSNAVGYGMDTGNIVAESDPRFVDGFENVLYYGNQERWNGKNLDNGFKPVTLGMGVASDRSGAEIGIASAIADNGEMNAIIKCAWGATHLFPDTNYDVSLKQGTWTSPTYIKNHNIDLTVDTMVGNMYRRFESTVNEALTLLIEDGYTPIIKGVWWMQGEAEMSTLQMSYEYRELYETLIYDMRNTLSEASGYDCSSVPFICGLPKWNTFNSAPPAYQETVRTAMITVADDLNNTGYVDCKPLNQHDNWHFDAEGQQYLGEQFIAAVEEFDSNDESNFGQKVSIESEIKLLADKIGLEFKANLTSYESPSKNEYGFIIVPTEGLAKNNINSNFIEKLDELYIGYEKRTAEVKVEKIDEVYSDIYFSCEIADVFYEDLNTSYTAIAYIKNEYGIYSYSSPFVSDSVARLASEQLYTDDENRDAIMKIVNQGINFIGGVAYDEREKEHALEIIADDSVTMVFSEALSPHILEISKSIDVDYFVRYSSSDPETVSVDERGVLTAHKTGEATITVECAGRSKEISVTVESLDMDGVILDGVINEGEYVGDVIIANNANVSAEVVGMIKNGNLNIAFELVHGEWSPYNSSWWLNDNIEIKLNGGTSSTVIFYEGVPTYSSNISYGSSKTEEVDGKLVTTVELCLENVPDINKIMICANGTNFGWLPIVHHNVCNTGYITEEGILVAKPIDMGNGIVLDGIFDESIYTEGVKSNAIKANGNGAGVEIIGTLTDQGIVFGVTINHVKSPDVTVITKGDWYTFMNIEFHFDGKGGEDDQYMFFANNRTKAKGRSLSYAKTVKTGNGYISTIEIFIPYEAIGAAADVEAVEFTARGWFETGWCDLLSNSWNATHKVTVEGLFKK